MTHPFARACVLRALAFVFLGALLLPSAPAAQPGRFEIGEKDFLLNGKPFVIRCGELHYTRVPREYWRQRLQACRAMGLNTVCVYLFWNYHEWREGTFTWSGEADAAEFCRIAQEEGLWVLLRPGPYSCAEWEMGGMPWWLLKDDGQPLRTTDPKFMEPAKRYLQEVGRQLAPLQITRGGPILMVQVENEYGYFGNDVTYMAQLRDAIRSVGFEVPLFACNPPYFMANGLLPDLFQAANFGSDPESAFKVLRKHQPAGPLMNAEYYPGWFDGWGRPHRTGTIEHVVGDLDAMLRNRSSFSLYMAHGGTTFGLWAGTDRPFRPDASSYDYDAPISESGRLTPKFYAIREVLSRHLEPGETLPPPPAEIPARAISEFHFSEFAPLLAAAETGGRAIGQLEPFERLGVSRGLAVYESRIPAGPAGMISAERVADFAWLYLNGEYIGCWDRRSAAYACALPARTAAARLQIVVEAVGRVNIGLESHDRKGLYGPVKITSAGNAELALTDWRFSPFELDNERAPDVANWSRASGTPKAQEPGFWRGTFQVSGVADTFLDARTWGKGVVWVNGRCLGRFWNIGPTQTLYCPGVWLREGLNEVVVLDLIGPSAAVASGLESPILDQLRPDLDFGPVRRVAGRPVVADADAGPRLTLTQAGEAQRVPFAKPARGRFLCVEVFSTFSGNPRTSFAEIDLQGAGGVSLAKDRWRILWASSEGLSAGDGVAENLLDGQSATSWMTDWALPFPQAVVIDLGRSEEVQAVSLLPRNGEPGDWAREVRVSLSEVPFGLEAK
ncbi:beta-galactosidase [Nibricoccus sp. IMCC34717]|uniref:beta-galactosidase n=1 Tax=Nibricoccus sp. IMCC34717 TaxID=3034021 RepID=UPI00384F8AF0